MKPLRYHPQVQQDINEAMRYYLENASGSVADRFWGELSSALAEIRARPASHHYDSSGLRRFPYHILYQDLPDRVRVQVIRHNSRNPEFGTRRQWG